jgi:hypothetical protein
VSFFLCLVFAVVFSVKTLAQQLVGDIIDIEDVELFLEQQTKKDSIAINSVVADKPAYLPDTLPISVQLKNSTDPFQSSLERKFILSEDSARIHKKAIKERFGNPLLIDWVFPYKDIPDNFDTENDAIRTIRKQAQIYILKNKPELFTYYASQLPKIEDVTGLKDDGYDLAAVEVVDSVNRIFEPIRIKLYKPSFWQKYGRVQIQASQNYISDNWYKGGESNISILTLFNGRLNYDNKKNIQWENALELKFGFNSAGSDSLRKIRTNEDLVKLNSRLGIKAFGTWYYTADVEFSTQFFNTYVPNSRERATGPFSPIRLYGSAGLNYKYKKMVSVLIAPFSYKLTAVADTSKADGVTVSIADKVGIAKGKTTLNEFGSLIKVDFHHSFSREINLESSLSFYTNYKGVEFDWEIIGNFIINRFLSARVSLHPRYDSTVILSDDEKPKLQFKELISLGFQYRF